MQQEVDRNVVEHQRGDDLVDLQVQLEQHRRQRPEQAAGHGADHHQRQAQRRRSDLEQRDCGRANRAPDHLAFQPQIPEPRTKRKAAGQTDHDQRRGLKQHRAQTLAVEQGEDDKLIEQLTGGHPGADQNRRRDQHADQQRQRDDLRLPVPGHLLAYFKGVPARQQRLKIRCIKHDSPWPARLPGGPPAGQTRR